LRQPNKKERSLSFQESIRQCLTKYAEFGGRATRSEFWWFATFVLLGTAASLLVSEVLAGVFQVAVLLPLLAVGARRLRDQGKSAWWLLFVLAPVGGIVLLMILWALPNPEQMSRPAAEGEFLRT
jgi:uncharacterized membrane protein YhaH (DUF805 family)